MDELGPPALVGEAVEQTVEMLVRLGATLRRESRRLVEHERVRILVDYHLADKFDFVFGQALSLRHGPRHPCGCWLCWRDPDLLPRFEAVSRNGSFATEPKLPGSRPARDHVEADVGEMTLEPAVEADSVVVFADSEGTGF